MYVADERLTDESTGASLKGALIVQDGAHRTESIRARVEDGSDPCIPCVVVSTSSSPYTGAVAAAASNVRAELARGTSLADKLSAVSAMAEAYCSTQSPHIEPSSAVWRNIRDFFMENRFTFPPFVEKDESFNHFQIAKALKPWSEARLADKTAFVDSRTQELFLALHGRGEELRYVIGRSGKPQCISFASEDHLGEGSSRFPLRDISMNAHLLHVDILLCPNSVQKKQISSQHGRIPN